MTHESMEAAREFYRRGKYEDAFRLYHALAELGDLECQSLVGWMYLDGTGVKQDDEKAFVWCRRATEQGDVPAQFYLAKLHVKKGNCEDAVKWLETAAGKKYAPAMFLLGHLHQLGKCVARNDDKAFDLISQAAEAGHLFARREYARFLMRGRLGFRNILKGFCIYMTLLLPALRAAISDPYTDRLRT